MRPLASAVLLVLGLAVVGCAAGRGNTAALEAELRQQEDRLTRLQIELRQTRDDLTVARREAESLRTQATEAGQVALAPEQADVLFRVEGLRINTLLTGGIDEDGRPGDEVLHLVVEPFDAGGNTVKLPGEVVVEVTDPAAEGSDREVGTWNYPPEKVRNAWQSGLFVTGFKFRLPWSVAPRHGTLVVHARLTAADGRRFDATETVRITPPPPGEFVAAPPAAPPAEVEWAAGTE